MSNDIDLTEISGRRYSWFSAMYQSNSLKSQNLGRGHGEALPSLAATDCKSGKGMFGEKVNSGRPLTLNTSEVKKNFIHIAQESLYFQLIVTGYMQSLTYQPMVNISIVPKVLST